MWRRVPYQVITTALGTRVLVLGYIYNFLQNANNTQIVFMNQSVLLPTFKQAMNEPAIDLIVVPCHIDPQSGVELSQLYQAIRAARPSTPLGTIGSPRSPLSARPVARPSRPSPLSVLLSGHRHVTYFKQYDPNAFTLESGKYFEVVGDISFTLSGDPGDRQLNALSYRWVPTALSQFSAMANVSEDEFLTPHGAMVKEMIRNYSTSLDLDQVYGCSPLTYSPYTWDASNSFFQLYVERVVPSMVFDASLPHTQVFIANSFTLRWYLYQGPVNKNDIYTVLPFNDTFYGVFSVMGSDLQTLITKLRSKSAAHLAEEPAAPPSPMATIRSMPRQRHHYCGVHPFDAQLPAYVVSLDPNTIQPNAVYDVLAAEYDVSMRAHAACVPGSSLKPRTPRLRSASRSRTFCSRCPCACPLWWTCTPRWATAPPRLRCATMSPRSSRKTVEPQSASPCLVYKLMLIVPITLTPRADSRSPPRGARAAPWQARRCAA